MISVNYLSKLWFLHFTTACLVPPGQTSNSAIMTDGAGYMNYAALHELTDRMKWPSVPVSVQARFAGAKGLFILHPLDRAREDEPRIYIRYVYARIRRHKFVPTYRSVLGPVR